MAFNGTFGVCALCHETKPLVDSHYVPKALYKFSRADELNNPNPLTSVKGTLNQISDQFRGNVLCAICEDRINKSGEKWVLANLPQNRNSVFKLQTAIKPLQPVHSERNLELCDVRASEAIDIQKIAYFAASIFWPRSGACMEIVFRWRAPEIDLGTYVEAIRLFLLNGDPFPDDVVLLVYIGPSTNLETIPGLYLPREGEGVEGCKDYWFFVPGVLFRLVIGTNIPSSARASNALNGKIIVDVEAMKFILQ